MQNPQWRLFTSLLWKKSPPLESLVGKERPLVGIWVTQALFPLKQETFSQERLLSDVNPLKLICNNAMLKLYTIAIDHQHWHCLEWTNTEYFSALGPIHLVYSFSMESVHSKYN